VGSCDRRLVNAQPWPPKAGAEPRAANVLMAVAACVIRIEKCCQRSALPGDQDQAGTQPIAVTSEHIGRERFPAPLTVRDCTKGSEKNRNKRDRSPIEQSRGSTGDTQTIGTPGSNDNGNYSDADRPDRIGAAVPHIVGPAWARC
jgi:hypothetical protein